MAEAIAPADAEAIVAAGLKAAYATRGETAKVATKVPNPMPPRMTRVSLAGTHRQTPGHFYGSIMAECWAATEVDAYALACTTYALLFAMDGEDVAGHHIADVTEVGGIVNFPDPATNAPRYQFVADLLIGGGLI